MTIKLVAIAELKKRADVIDRNQDDLGRAVETFAAIAEIRDLELWRNQPEDYQSLHDYLKRRHPVCLGHCYRILSGQKALELASEGDLIDVEITGRAAAELAKVPDEQKAEVLKEASKGQEKVTAPDVKKAAKEVAEKSKPKPKSKDKKKPAEESGEKMVDALGSEICHKHVAGAFLQVSRITDLINAANKLKRDVLELASDSTLGQHVNGQGCGILLKNLAKELRDGIPYALCPWCKGKRCEHCCNAGWVPKQVYERAPEELKTQ